MGQPDFTKIELNPYYEYGWDDRLTVGLSPFFHYIDQQSTTGGSESNLGLAETEVFARYKVIEQGDWVFSLQPTLKLPSLYTDSSGVKAGRTAMDAELAALFGIGFDAWGEHHFAGLEAAYRHRFGELDDQFITHATLGLGINEQWQVVTEAESIFRVDDRAGAVSVSGQNNYNLTKAQISAIYKLEDGRAWQAGFYRHIAGRDTGAGGGILLSHWWYW